MVLVISLPSGDSGRREIQPLLSPIRAAVIARLLSAPATLTSRCAARSKAPPVGVERRSMVSPKVIRSAIVGYTHVENHGPTKDRGPDSKDRRCLSALSEQVVLIIFSAGQ